ncbi:TonB-dependent receptor [Massilia sp. TS11]|uniref:TonB-dependent receptor n=1 Tax=Massilia sp. TS11 TaxID=2908003 RepID=UPI001EDA4491|nr:TonB-dependent receptor [Massilia sp. TS11]MCG2586083.1 TonB-dependent receptor [Massilia sp. TS11]
MKKTPLHHRTLLALAVGAAFPLHGAWAEEAKAAEDKAQAGQLETVIVTAQRRSENIKDVPMAISTMKGEKLDAVTAAGQDIRFMAGRTPSLNVESDFGRTFPRFYIRGLGNTDFDLNASQPVGLVYDDVVQESPILKGFPVFDVDQVEVLRGPQGTLFGRNSPAGVIKFDSTKPTSKLEGYGNFGFGKDSTINAEAALNLPLDKNWAMRVSVLDQHRGDRVHNPNPNSPVHDLEGYNDKAARIQFQYKDDKLTANLNLHGRDYKGNATLFRANIIKKGTNELVDGFRYDYYPTDGGNVQTLQSHGAVLRLKYSLDDLTLHSITGYDKAKYYSWGDVDGGFGAVYAPPMGPDYGSQKAVIPFDSQTADGLPDLKQITQEFRVESNYAGPLQWIGGLYYFKEDIQVDSFNFWTFSGNKQHGYAVQHQHAKSWAAFASLNYQVSPELKVRAGIRYTDDKKDFDAIRTQNPFDDLKGVGPLTTHPRANNTSWDLAATYTLDKDTNLFTRLATGYRAPSIQGRILFGDTISVANSEHATSFEAGVKQDLFNRRARLTAAFFHYEVKDLQLTAGSGSVNQNRLVNAAKAIGQGVELDAQAILSDELRATIGASYNDTEIRDPNLFVSPCGAPCTVTNPTRTVGGGTVALINGNPLPRAPKWTTNFTLRWSRNVGEGELYAYTDWSYRSDYNMFLYEAKEYKAKSLLEGGLRVGYKWADGKYELAAYGRNITNKVQVVAAIDFNNLTGIVNEPRTYGLQFKANF